jgi:hypothetical protein
LVHGKGIKLLNFEIYGQQTTLNVVNEAAKRNLNETKLGVWGDKIKGKNDNIS